MKMSNFIIPEKISKYLEFIIAAYFIVGILRIFELILIAHHYSLSSFLIVSEITGFGYDLLLSTILFLFLFPIFLLLYKFQKLVHIIYWFWAMLLSFIHFILLKYFLYQLVPLDVFLFQYTIDEILFTIKSSETKLLPNLFLLLFVWLTVGLSIVLSKKIKLASLVQKAILFLAVISIPLYSLLNSYFSSNSNIYSKNKTAYFIGKTYNYFKSHFLEESYDNLEIQVKAFHNLYPSKVFVDDEYPLVHKAKQQNQLGAYLEKFDSSPHIVFLIIEGLNDDFLHEFKGELLMPFLSKLKDESLYWERCFSVGERSFAVVPSVLGALPYGQKGFTLLDHLPRHLSLVSILKSNNYYTSFFYGQGAWFHQKDRFFKYNNIDLIFDNQKFHSKYSKIIVGEDQFFWGYNDKDLFNQSLEVIDTLNKSKRLDVYFTGTSHSPFSIADNTYYSQKLEELTKNENREFFDTNEKYIKSLLFVDDALKDFFENYKSRSDYKNTIFIITGDHPMTEMPIANSLKSYHVPLLIFSEKIIKPEIFSNTVSHLDIPETILSFLNDYISNTCSVSTSLGESLFSNDVQTPKHIAFMNDNREIVDYYSEGYYLSEGLLFQVDSNFGIKKFDDRIVKAKMVEELDAIKAVSLHASLNNKIISKKLFCDELELTIFCSIDCSDSIKLNSEYYNLTDQIEIPNVDFGFDINLNINASSTLDLSVVVQIMNSKDSIVFWNNLLIKDDNPNFRAHVKVNKLLLTDTLVYFKTYIWNRKNAELTINNVDLLLYGWQ